MAGRGGRGGSVRRRLAGGNRRDAFRAAAPERRGTGTPPPRAGSGDPRLRASKVPALGGQLFCDATFTPSRGQGTAKATIVVHTGTSASFVYSLTGSGLKPAPTGESYEVWTIPEVNMTSGGYQLDRGVAPTLLGVIAPPVAADGLLAASGTIPPSYIVSYRFLLTVQRPAAKSPGRVVLRGDVPL
jgi:hypothetical protein